MLWKKKSGIATGSDLDVKRFVSKNGKNQYLLVSGNEAAAIDIAEAKDDVIDYLSQKALRLTYLLITHAHPRHVQALPELKEKLGGAFCLHEYEVELLNECIPAFEPDLIVKDNQRLPLGNTYIKVLLTPGHTKGSVCFYIPQAHALFSGSSFLRRGYGRIWGPSSMSLMYFSLKRLSSSIPAETTIYTGSEEVTTMAAEGWIHCIRSA